MATEQLRWCEDEDEFNYEMEVKWDNESEDDGSVFEAAIDEEEGEYDYESEDDVSVFYAAINKEEEDSSGHHNELKVNTTTASSISIQNQEEEDYRIGQEK